MCRNFPLTRGEPAKNTATSENKTGKSGEEKLKPGKAFVSGTDERACAVTGNLDVAL